MELVSGTSTRRPGLVEQEHRLASGKVRGTDRRSPHGQRSFARISRPGTTSFVVDFTMVASSPAIRNNCNSTFPPTSFRRSPASHLSPISKRTRRPSPLHSVRRGRLGAAREPLHGPISRWVSLKSSPSRDRRSIHPHDLRKHRDASPRAYTSPGKWRGGEDAVHGRAVFPRRAAGAADGVDAGDDVACVHRLAEIHREGE